MSGKSQTIVDITFFRPSQILPMYRTCAKGLSQIFPIMNYLFVIPAIYRIGNERNPSLTDADVPDGTNLSFHFLGMITDHRRNLGRVGKIETLPILQICPRSSQTIGDMTVGKQ